LLDILNVTQWQWRQKACKPDRGIETYSTFIDKTSIKVRRPVSPIAGLKRYMALTDFPWLQLSEGL